MTGAEAYAAELAAAGADIRADARHAAGCAYLDDRPCTCKRRAELAAVIRAGLAVSA